MRITYTIIDDNSIHPDNKRTLTLRWREYYTSRMDKHTISSRKGRDDLHHMAFIFAHMLKLGLKIAWTKKRGNLTVTRFESEE